MIFTMDGKIRYSEVGEDKKLTVTKLVNYLQDSVMLHSEHVGEGIKSLGARKEGWFLTAWQIDIDEVPTVYDDVKVHTSPYDFKGGFGFRNFWMENTEGKRMVAANSCWIFMDLDKMCPKKITEEAMEPYLPMIPAIEMEYLPRKIKVPADCQPLLPVKVTSDLLDSNHHVNNCQYIDVAMKVLELSRMPRRIRAEYKKAAVLGEVFHPFYKEENGNFLVDLQDGNGTTFAVVTFEYSIGE